MIYIYMIARIRVFGFTEIYKHSGKLLLLNIRGSQDNVKV